jgi:ribonucleoside-diphosphate reductase alpha chain
LHIEELSEIHEVFKTFGEINQYELLRQAGDRQKYIDQGQSLNIHIPPKTSVKEINAIHIHAWECGVKGLYYQRSKSPSSGFSLKDVCTSCAG